jgi:2-keto-3-deoxy-L-rhamnonate aldolase RhmA
VDVLFVGPADLSHSLGVPGLFTDPGYLAALERVAQAGFPAEMNQACGEFIHGWQCVPSPHPQTRRP